MGAKKQSEALAATQKSFLPGGGNQPPRELKKLGWAKKRLLHEILAAKLPDPNNNDVNRHPEQDCYSPDEELKLLRLASTFNLNAGQLTIQLAMDLTMAKEVIFNKNVAAYVALTNRAYGLPKVNISSENKNMKLVNVVVTFDDTLPPPQEPQIISSNNS